MSRRWREAAFALLCGLAVAVALAALAALLADVAAAGWRTLTWGFLTGYPSRRPEEAGFLPAVVGSVYVLALVALLAFPVGVGAAVYLEEYAQPGRLTRLLELNLANLAAVPSIVYGLLGLGLFVRTLGLGRSVLAGALTLSLLVLPLVIVASREAIRAVPASVREAAYALGATRWQVVRHQVLPLALPGILTGTILALARAIGETAPLIAIGALTYVAFLPRSVFDPFTVMPIQIFNWISRPQEGFHALAASGILVLLAAMLACNALAIGLRLRLQARQRW
jgi:phosphate transport system permease protein